MTEEINKVEPELRKDNTVGLTGYVWDPPLDIPPSEIRESEFENTVWRSVPVMVKIEDILAQGFKCDHKYENMGDFQPGEGSEPELLAVSLPILGQMVTRWKCKTCEHEHYAVKGQNPNEENACPKINYLQVDNCVVNAQRKGWTKDQFVNWMGSLWDFLKEYSDIA